METYGFKKKRKKVWIIPLILVAAVAVIIYVVGLIVNISGISHERVNSAVSENIALKQQVEALNREIDNLKEQIDSLNGELSLREEVVAEETQIPLPQEETYESPRNNSYR